MWLKLIFAASSQQTIKYKRNPQEMLCEPQVFNSSFELEEFRKADQIRRDELQSSTTGAREPCPDTDAELQPPIEDGLFDRSDGVFWT